MNKNGCKYLIWSLAWLLVASITLVEVIAQADVTPPLPVDPLLAYMQAAGFPAWAAVVAWGVLRISNEFRTIATRLDSFVLQTERRLARVEAQINVHHSQRQDHKDLPE